MYCRNLTALIAFTWKKWLGKNTRSSAYDTKPRKKQKCQMFFIVNRAVFK